MGLRPDERQQRDASVHVGELRLSPCSHYLLCRGDRQDSRWQYYYNNGLWQEVAFATFGDKERESNLMCGSGGCHSCRKMLGPGGEEGPHSGHASPFMRCQYLSVFVFVQVVGGL